MNKYKVTLMVADTPVNGRIYPKKVLEEALKNIKEPIFGEFVQPLRYTLNEERFSHTISNIKMDGTHMIGEMLILDTKMGNQLKTRLSKNKPTALAARGKGDINDDLTVSDYEIISFDITSKPGFPECYVKEKENE